MSTYLVTGAAGFIGSNVTSQLLAAGHTVVGLDNLNDYYDVRLKDWRLSRLLGTKSKGLGEDPKVSVYADQQGASGALPLPINASRFTFHKLDIENLSALEAVFAAHSFDAVFNLAARAGVRASLEQPELYRRTNILGEENMLKCQVKFGVKKHVLASSSTVYAGCPMPFTEDAVLGSAQSPYAETKKQAELLAFAYHQRHGLDISVLRYFTVFGPAGRPDMAPLRFIKWIDEGTPITLYGDGSQARDFTYVDDIARGTILAAKPMGHEIINLGGGNNPLTITAMIQIIERALGKKAKISGQPPSAADMKETWADIAKAKRLLGWEPQATPQIGFTRAVEWHANNRDWLKTIRV